MFKENDGAVLVISIIVLAVLILLSTALTYSINNQISFVKSHENRLQAFYAAEAGIEKGINLLINNRSSVDDFIDDDGDTDNDGYYKNLDVISFKDSDYELRVKKGSEENKYLFKAVGESGDNGSKVIQAGIEINAYNGVFNNALTSNDTINLFPHNGNLKGDIYSNGSTHIVSQNGAEHLIDGNIYSKGATTITAQHSDTKQEINGDIFSEGSLAMYSIFGGQQTVNGKSNIGQFDLEYNQQEMSSIFDFYLPGGSGWKNEGWSSYNAKKTINLGLNNEIYKINGSKSLNNIQIDGSGILVFDSDFSVKNNFKVNLNNEDDFLIIIANGNVELNKHIEGNFFIYSKEEIIINYQTASGKLDMEGSLMAEKDITITPDKTSNFNSPNEFNISHNSSFTQVFADLGYEIPSINSNNSNDSGDNGSSEVEIFSWEEG